MKFGLYHAFRNPQRWYRPFPQVYEEIFEQTAYSEELGWDSVWLMEHHFVEDGYVPSLLPTLAGLAMQTKRIKLGTFALDLNFQHPIRLAEDAAIVDILSNGRLILGVSAGYALHEYEGFGVRWKDRVPLLEEQLEVLLKCWNEDRFSFKGRFYNLKNVSVTPRPVQQPRPPIWYGGITIESVRRFVRLHVQPKGPEAFLNAMVRGKRADIFREELAKHGEKLEDLPGGDAMLWMYVCDDAEQGWQEIKDHALHLYGIYRPWTLQAGEREPAHKTAWTDNPRSHFITGPPEHCIKVIEEHLATLEVPPEYFLLGMHLPGLEHKKVMRSIELFSKHVMPHFRQAQGDRVRFPV